MYDSDESYYEILKVPMTATTSEIVNAYHLAKNAFSKDSMATYSLLSREEITEMLQKLEVAYSHLSNADKRRQYDKWLAAREKGDGPVANPGGGLPSGSVSAPLEFPKPDRKPAPAVDYTTVTGGLLKQVRESRGLALEDVARITKIPAKQLSVIESDDVSSLPARVYLQGFVKNLAVLYKLDVKATAAAYISFLEQAEKKNVSKAG